MAVEVAGGPPVQGTVPRDAVFTMLRAAGLDPGVVQSFSSTVYEITATVYCGDADGNRWATPDGVPVTYQVRRRLTDE